ERETGDSRRLNGTEYLFDSELSAPRFSGATSSYQVCYSHVSAGPEQSNCICPFLTKPTSGRTTHRHESPAAPRDKIFDSMSMSEHALSNPTATANESPGRIGTRPCVFAY